MQRALRLESIIVLRRFSLSAFALSFEWLADQLFEQRDHIFLWIPVFFAVGIGAYFLLPFEPPLALGLMFWLFSVCLHVFSKGFLRYLFFALVLICSGFMVSSLRTVTVDTPVLVKQIKFADVSGHVVLVEPMEEGGGSRVVLSNLFIDGMARDETPRKIRLRLRHDDNVFVGQRIKTLASLTPLSAPVVPGGFDFRRYLYFEGIGAVGFIYKAPEILKDTPTRFEIIEQWRGFISERIRASLTTQHASVALALIVGQKNALSNEDRQVLRDSGLAHMLAISGLHVGLVSGVLFFILRFFLAAFPVIALNYPIKKIAAVFAFMGAVFYMLLAGMTVPTQRAVLMSGVVFLAILMDRSPVSLRLVAFSALLVLFFRPESLLSASFHMSFAAVTCLVYFYDLTRNFWSRHYTNSNWSRRAMLYFLTVCITTLIASIATAPFALHHFGQVSFIGSVANLVAVPLFAFLIMPFALLSTLLTVVGFEYWPLQVVGAGIELVMGVAYWASELPYAIYKSVSWNFWSFVAFICSGLWIILWKGYGKLLALFPALLSIQLSQAYILPDFLLSPSHKLFSYADDDDLYVSTRRNDKFVLKRWEEYYGLEEGSATKLTNKGVLENNNRNYICGEVGCRFNINGQNISFLRHSYAQVEECIWADVLISVNPVDKDGCASPHIVDKFDTWRWGAHAIWILPSQVRIERTQDYIGTRPWSAYNHQDR